MADETTQQPVAPPPVTIPIETEPQLPSVPIDLNPEYDPAKDKRAPFLKIKPNQPGPTIEAAPDRSVGQVIKEAVTENIPQFSNRTVYNPKYGKESFLPDSEIMTQQQRREAPALAGVLDVASEIATPSNLATGAATAGLGEAGIIPKVLSGLFAGQIAADVYDQYPALKAAVNKAQTAKTKEEHDDAFAEAQQLLTHMGAGAVMGLLAAKHGAEGAKEILDKTTGSGVPDQASTLKAETPRYAVPEPEETYPEHNRQTIKALQKLGYSNQHINQFNITEIRDIIKNGTPAAEYKFPQDGRRWNPDQSSAAEHPVSQTAEEAKTPTAPEAKTSAPEPDKFAEVGGKLVSHQPEVSTSAETPAETETVDPIEDLIMSDKIGGKKVRGAAPKEEPTELVRRAVPTTPTGLVERSTGDEKADLAIKSAGAIPAGNSLGLSLFHDPKTGSTLALKPEDVTPERVQQHLATSRQAFGIKPEPAAMTSAGGKMIGTQPTSVQDQHPTVSALKDKFGVSTNPGDMTKGGASFLHADGTVTNIGASDHPAAIAAATGQKAADIDRTGFINDTNSIRVRHRPAAKAGPEIVFSVPENGVTSDQVDMMKQAVGKMGRNGNLLIEVAHEGNEPSESVRSWPENDVKEFARPSDVEPLLQKMGAHPDQRDLISKELQTPHKETYGMEITNREGKTQKVPIDAHSPKQALNTLTKKFPDAHEWRLDTMPEEKEPSAEYSVPSGKIQKMKEDVRPEIATIRHELGHAMVALDYGLKVKGMISSSHPNATPDMRAGVLIAGQGLYERGPNGKPQIREDKRLAVLKQSMAGIAADELFNNVPRAANHNFNITKGGDGTLAYNILTDAGFHPVDALKEMHRMIDETKEFLARQHVSDVIKENENFRESGLSRQYHYSPERLQNMHAEIQRRIANEKTTGTAESGNQPAGGAVATGGREADVTGGKGEVSPADYGLAEGDEEGIVSEEKLKKRVANIQQNAAAGFIKPDGTFQELTEGSHPEDAEKMGTTVPRLRRQGWVRKAGQGSYEAGKLNPTTTAAIERDIIMDLADYKEGNEYGLPVDTIVLDTANGNYEIPVDDFIEKYNGSLDKAMAAKSTLVMEEKVKKEAGVSPNKKLQASAQKYAAAQGMDEINHEPVQQNLEHAREIARIYDEAKHDPNDPRVKAAYNALKSETLQQFHHLRDDLGLKFEPQEADPYSSAGEMMNDIKKNNRLKVFTGSSTGEDHPLSEVAPGTGGQTYNTVFHWVHDAMGHAAGGNDFSENGEKSATEAHAQMYSDTARPAMRAETEGQTSWFFHNPEVESGKMQPGKFAEQKATILPDVSHDWHQTAGKMAAKNEAGGINPRTGKSDKVGIGTEIMPEARQNLDHPPTAADFQKFYDQHKEIFDKYPELRIGWDNKSAVQGGHEINIGAVGPDAARVAKKLDQKSAFDIEKGEIIPTKGSGLRTEFPNYSIDERIRDLKGQTPSDIKGFEHLSKPVYDNLEPDERDYLKGEKTLQRNVMAQYHKIAPSVNETTNAMQAGAALGGWWKRYIDIFHGLVGDEKTIGGKPPAGKLLYHYTPIGNFEQFNPMIGGEEGQFGTHFGTQDQAHDRMENTEPSSRDAHNIRPVYVDIKNPIRLSDTGSFNPQEVANQLIHQKIISKKEMKMIAGSSLGSVDPEKLRELIEKKGYDGIVYLNRTEGISREEIDNLNEEMYDDADLDYSDRPTDTAILNRHPELKNNDSYIALRPEQITPKYSAEMIANTIGPSHAEVLKQWHSAVSGNKSVQDANNLAWHTYADWLDAGKPTDRKSINNIVKKSAAQPVGSEKRGNAAMHDVHDRKGKVTTPGLDTTKLYNLVNSPEMKGERPFSGDVFKDDAKNPLMGSTEGARKIPSMGATVAGKGNLNRLVIDAHIRDFYGRTQSGGPAAQYIADSAHLRQAAKAFGLKGGEGQEQLWGTVLGLKTLLKEGLTPEEASGKLDADLINSIGKDYAEVILNDPEITGPGGVLDRLAEQHKIGRGSAGASEAYSKIRSASTSQGESRSSQTGVDPALLGKTAERIRGQISESKIKKPSTPAPTEEEGDTSFEFGANAPKSQSIFKREPKPAKKTGAINAADFIKALQGLKTPAPKTGLKIKHKQTANKVDMADPDSVHNAAVHEASHAVASELLEPGSVENMVLSDRGGVTNTRAAAGVNTPADLNHTQLIDMLATSLAGGLGEPGGTSRAGSSTDLQNRERLMGPQGMTKGPELTAEALARHNALMADPHVHYLVDTLATKLADKKSLTGDEVRKHIQTTPRQK